MQMQTPNMPAVTLNARAWVEHRSKIGAYKATAHGCWGVAGILDDLIAGRTQHAPARAALMILQFDQVSIDRGSWALAAELSLEQQPPFSPSAVLLDSRWAEVMLAHLKDAEEYVRKFHSKGCLEAKGVQCPKLIELMHHGHVKAKPATNDGNCCFAQLCGRHDDLNVARDGNFKANDGNRCFAQLCGCHDDLNVALDGTFTNYAGRPKCLAIRTQ